MFLLPIIAGDLTDVVLIPGLGRSSGEGNGNPLQYARVENPMAREAWWATAHSVTKSQIWLRWLSTYVFPGGSMVKNLLSNPMLVRYWVGKIPWKGGYPCQYSCLENSMEPGRLQSKGLQSWTQLSDSHTHVFLLNILSIWSRVMLAISKSLPCRLWVSFSWLIFLLIRVLFICFFEYELIFY